MKTKVNSIAIAAIVAVLATSSSAATNLLQNGSFEDLTGGVKGSGSVTAGTWGTWSQIDGWTDQGGTNFEIQTNATLSWLDAQEGNNYVELDAHKPRSSSNAQVGQQVNLTAGKYNLTFYYSPRVNKRPTNTNDILFSVGTVLTGAINGAPNLDFPHRVWTKVSRNFVVTSQDDFNVLFGGSGKAESLGGFIDNVSLSAVPLPAGALLLLGGLGGFAGLRRRKG